MFMFRPHLKGDLYFLHRLILFDLSLQRNVITEDINENIQVYPTSQIFLKCFYNYYDYNIFSNLILNDYINTLEQNNFAFTTQHPRQFKDKRGYFIKTFSNSFLNFCSHIFSKCNWVLFLAIVYRSAAKFTACFS